MTSYDYEKQSYDVRGGRPSKNASSISNFLSLSTPSERFHATRDLAFVAIILLHMGSAILTIPTIVTKQALPDTIKYCIAVIVLGVLVPIVAAVGFRDHGRIARYTCALWWELTWTFCFFLVDFVITILHASKTDASQTIIGLTCTESIFLAIYFCLLAILTFQHRRLFPGGDIWKHSVQSINWLRSSVPTDPNGPPLIRKTTISKPIVIAPWDQEYEDELEKIRSEQDLDRKVRLAAAEDDMLYAMNRYGIRPGSLALKLQGKPKPKVNISKPLPVVPRGSTRYSVASSIPPVPKLDPKFTQVQLGGLKYNPGHVRSMSETVEQRKEKREPLSRAMSERRNQPVSRSLTERRYPATPPGLPVPAATTDRTPRKAPPPLPEDFEFEIETPASLSRSKTLPGASSSPSPLSRSRTLPVRKITTHRDYLEIPPNKRLPSTPIDVGSSFESLEELYRALRWSRTSSIMTSAPPRQD